MKIRKKKRQNQNLLWILAAIIGRNSYIEPKKKAGQAGHLGNTSPPTRDCLKKIYVHTAYSLSEEERRKGTGVANCDLPQPQVG